MFCGKYVKFAMDWSDLRNDIDGIPSLIK